MADSASNIQEHEKVADTDDESIFVTFLGNVVRYTPLSHVVCFQRHQIDALSTVARNHFIDSVNNGLVIVLAGIKLGMIILIHCLVKAFDASNEHISFPRFGSICRVLVIVEQKSNL